MRSTLRLADTWWLLLLPQIYLNSLLSHWQHGLSLASRQLALSGASG